MKKFLRLCSASLIMLNSSIVLVACRPATLGEVWIITDGGDLFDKAFNQQVIEGSRDFANMFNQNRQLISQIPGFEYWKNHSVRVKWIISKDGELSTLQNNYNIAGYAGAKTIIAAGFHHIPALTPKVQSIYRQLGVRFILIDSVLSNPINLAGLTYASEKSSFLAALAAAIWLLANYEVYDRNGLKMSTFGGLASDVIVENMSGYYWGVYYFNQYKDSNSDILTMINAIRRKQDKDDLSAAELANKNITFEKLPNSFSGGFESGTPNAKAITSQLINDVKNDIVFPVAGAQTTDLISAIVNSPTNKTAKIIGVDVDQSEQYDYAKDYFLTSALKGIRTSVDWMLWHSFNLKKDNDSQEITFDPNGEKYFNGEFQYSPLTEKTYLGISNNPAISTIYNQLINDSDKYWNLADKVLFAFQKLANDLANINDPKKWDNAWRNDIDKSNPKYIPEF